MNELDEKLVKHLQTKQKSWGKLIHLMKRRFDEWASAKIIDSGYHDFRMAFMPFIMNIGLEGTTNGELAIKANVTKQAMSKVIKELETMGYIKVVPSKEDRRSSMIFLSERGKKFVVHSRECVDELTQEYKKLVGKENLAITMDVLGKIIDYHTK